MQKLESMGNTIFARKWGIMAKTRVAINGFGRIGRLAARLLLADDDMELVAINDLTANNTLAHLLQYDSTHGPGPADVQVEDDAIVVNGTSVRALSEPEPANAPWQELDIDIVLECTGHFRDRKKAEQHLQSGAKRVIISAPAKDDVKTIVLGVNDHILEPSDKVLSNASCTTNCLAPMVKELNNAFGIKKGFMSTTHAYTADQNLQDGPHDKDLRRARAAGMNIVPTSTNAAHALDEVLPEVEGKISATAIRVPVVDGSLTELTCILNRSVDSDGINQVFQQVAQDRLHGIVEYAEAPLVSTDIIGNSHSCIFDSLLTEAKEDFVKITGWYDNEAGYANRLIELTNRVSQIMNANTNEI